MTTTLNKLLVCHTLEECSNAIVDSSNIEVSIPIFRGLKPVVVYSFSKVAGWHPCKLVGVSFFLQN